MNVRQRRQAEPTRCPYCFEPALPLPAADNFIPQIAPCPSCQAMHHVACAVEHGGCASCGWSEGHQQPVKETEEKEHCTLCNSKGYTIVSTMCRSEVHNCTCSAGQRRKVIDAGPRIIPTARGLEIAKALEPSTEKPEDFGQAYHNATCTSCGCTFTYHPSMSDTRCYECWNADVDAAFPTLSSIPWDVALVVLGFGGFILWLIISSIYKAL